MLQFIWKHFPKTRATFTLTNRTTCVPLGDIVDLDRVARATGGDAQAALHKSELIWLAGNTFYGRRGIFEPAFLEWLEHDFRLSDFELTVEDGQISLRFDGLWTETTMWEIYALSAIDELKTRASLKNLSEFELDILYARAKTRLWEKMERLRGVPGLSVSDFGTRRRHSFLWQEYVVTAMAMCWARTLRAARIHISRTSTIWRRSAPMRMNCRWRWRRWQRRTRSEAGAVPAAGAVAADVSGRIADSAAGHVRDDAVFTRCAGVGDAVDGPAHRQQGPVYCRR